MSALFERCVADGDLDGLMALYEDDAVFPTSRGISTGHDEIRATLEAYLDSGAKLEFGETNATLLRRIRHLRLRSMNRQL